MTRSHGSGFTIVEQLITLLLVVILATLATPALSRLQQKERDTAAMEELLGFLQFARSHAVLHKSTLTLCPSQDGKICLNDWNEQWLLHQASAQKTLRWEEAYKGQNRLNWSGFSGSIRFLPNGTSPISNGRFYICAERIITHQLIINRQGRIRRGSAEENHQESSRCP